MLPLCCWGEDESSCVLVVLQSSAPSLLTPSFLQPTPHTPPPLSLQAPSPSPTTSLTPSWLPVQCCLRYMSTLRLMPHSVLKLSLIPGRCFTPIGELN